MQRNRYSKEFKVHEIIAATKGTASDVLLAFHAFPAEHWVHRRTTHPSESTFATLRHHTTCNKKSVSRTTFLSLAFKRAEKAAKSRRRIITPQKVQELLGGTW